jgi:hypothetical protein
VAILLVFATLEETDSGKFYFAAIYDTFVVRRPN